MADKCAVTRLSKGAEVWNKYRVDNEDWIPDLTNCDLYERDLRQVNFSNANLTGAELRFADLRGADLSGALLKGAKLYRANLNQADLQGASGLELNANSVLQTRFGVGAWDSWSVLRRSYTGHRFFVHLLLLLAFVMPLVLKTMMWLAVAQAFVIIGGDSNSMGTLATLKQRTNTLLAIETAVTPIEALRTDTLCDSTSPDPIYVIELVTGWREKGWQLFFFLAVVVYNVLRGTLTFRVSLLREEEERTMYSPALHQYRGLYRFNLAVWGLSPLLIAAQIWNVYHWLWTPVQLPIWLGQIMG